MVVIVIVEVLVYTIGEAVVGDTTVVVYYEVSVHDVFHFSRPPAAPNGEISRTLGLAEAVGVITVGRGVIEV